jgi:hypothetical protein
MPAIYLHSPGREFAETQRMPEAAYLGRRVRRSSLKLFVCGCESPVLARITRSFWMRFAFLFRHYLCRACGNRVFRLKAKQRLVYSAVYLPAQPRNPDVARTLQSQYARLLQCVAFD